MGILIQVNAFTVEGKMGRKPAKAVRYMLKNRMVDFLGTDAHSNGNRAPYIEKCAEILRKNVL